jgi:hypothetical protein
MEWVVLPACDGPTSVWLPLNLEPGSVDFMEPDLCAQIIYEQ